MPIRVACPGCFKIIVADDHDAGRRARCPECHAVLTLSASGQDESPLAPAYAFFDESAEEPSERLGGDDPAKATGRGNRKEHVACPYCAEPIRYGARKCRHCGEYLDDDLRRQQRRAGYDNLLAPGARANAGIAAVLSLFFPGAGQIYREKIGVGIAWFIAVSIGYILLVIPGLVLHGFCIYDAASNE